MKHTQNQKKNKRRFCSTLSSTVFMHRTPVAYLTPTIFLLHKGPHQSPLFVINNFQKHAFFFFQICIYRVYIINMLMLIIFTENDCKNYIYKSCLGLYRFLNIICLGILASRFFIKRNWYILK
jgi:hypothetical protein